MTTLFDDRTVTVTVGDLVQAVRRQRARVAASAISPHEPAAPAQRGSSIGRAVAVAGAHPGAGATAVAVALSDAVARIGHAVRLIDAAQASDAFAAAEVEVAADPGCRRARRGSVEVVRGESVNDFEPGAVTVVDGTATGTAIVAARVVVCRATVPSVGAAERVLTPEDVLAVVGARKWPRLIASSLGPALAQASRGGRVVFFQPDRGLALRGVDATPMPPHLLEAAGRLAELLWPDCAMPTSTCWRVTAGWKGAARW